MRAILVPASVAPGVREARLPRSSRMIHLATPPSHPSPAASPRVQPGRRRWRRLYAPLVILLILIIAGGVALRVLQPKARSEGTPAPAAASLTPQEHAYYAYVSPRLHQLVGEADRLAELGSHKSRNVLALQQGYNRVTKLIGEIRAYGKAHGVPSRFAAASQNFERGATQMTNTMAASEQAFFKFKWDELNAQLVKFQDANTSLRAAMAALDRSGGVATPPATGA